MSVISIFFIDKPVALWIHEVGLDRQLFLTNITETAQYWLSAIYIIAMFIYPSSPGLKKYQINNVESRRSSFKAYFCSSLFKITYFIFVILIVLLLKIRLKIFFGRDWPLHWGGSHGGLVPDGVYQFNILKSRDWEGSYPSGHATFAATASMVMYLLYPKARWLWIILSLIIILSILALNYHFVGDCLAGFALGCLFAYYGVAIYYYIILK